MTVKWEQTSINQPLKRQRPLWRLRTCNRTINKHQSHQMTLAAGAQQGSQYNTVQFAINSIF